MRCTVTHEVAHLDILGNEDDGLNPNVPFQPMWLIDGWFRVSAVEGCTTAGMCCQHALRKYIMLILPLPLSATYF